MRRRAFLIAGLSTLIGCSFAPRTNIEPLQPLPTTGVNTLSPASDTRSIAEREADFIENVRKGFPGALPKNNEQMLADGRFWCDAYASGLTRNEINDYAEATAVSSQHLRLTRVVIANAFLDLCAETD